MCMCVCVCVRVCVRAFGVRVCACACACLRSARVTWVCAGGMCALVGSVVIGPRAGRFRVSASGVITVRDIDKHSSSLACLGVWILFFGCVRASE